MAVEYFRASRVGRVKDIASPLLSHHWQYSLPVCVCPFRKWVCLLSCTDPSVPPFSVSIKSSRVSKAFVVPTLVSLWQPLLLSCNLCPNSGGKMFFIHLAINVYISGQNRVYSCLVVKSVFKNFMKFIHLCKCICVRAPVCQSRVVRQQTTYIH